jgi:hypothetical protein
MTSGYLYLLSNPAMPGLIKIGKTTRDPAERVRELSSATGVPSPFVLLYSQPVANVDAAERFAHAELERRGHRHSSDREFFKAPTHEAVQVLLIAAQLESRSDTNEDASSSSDSITEDRETYGTRLFNLALEHLKGSETTLRNPREALVLFEQAASLGVPLAAHLAANLYMNGKEGIAEDLEKAFELYQRAASGGFWQSLAAIAMLLERNQQKENSEEYWRRFFARAVEERAAAVSQYGPEDERVMMIDETVGELGSNYRFAVYQGRVRDIVPVDDLRPFVHAIVTHMRNVIAKQHPLVRERLAGAINRIQLRMGLPRDY